MDSQHSNKPQEETEVDAEQQPDASTAVPGESPGSQLRAAREKAGLTQQALAEKLYLRVTNIQDIEEDRLSEGTSLTFLKGYVRLYAKHVGLNEQAILADFDALHNAEAKSPAKLQSFSKRVAKQAHDDRWMMVTYIILLGLLAAVVVWWYQQSGEDTQPASNSSTTTSTIIEKKPEPVASQQLTQQLPQPTQQSPAQPADSNDAEVTLNADDEAADESQVSLDNMPEAMVGEVAQQAPNASEQESVSALAEPTDLVFRFSADCWINITDATGEAIAYGVKQAGRVMEVAGVAPFDITLGAPEAVSIELAGTNVDISSFQNGRTARFRLPFEDTL